MRKYTVRRDDDVWRVYLPNGNPTTVTYPLSEWSECVRSCIRAAQFYANYGSNNAVHS